MKNKLKKYFRILGEINWLQTFLLYLKISKPRSSSIRVFNKSSIYLCPSSKIIMKECSYLEINRQDYMVDKGRNCRLSLGQNSIMNILGGVSIHCDTSIYVHDGAILSMGGNTYLNGCNINCSYEISIGNDCAIAAGVRIMDNSWHEIFCNETHKESK